MISSLVFPFSESSADHSVGRFCFSSLVELWLVAVDSEFLFREKLRMTSSYTATTSTKICTMA